MGFLEGMGRAGCPSCGGPLAVDWQRGEVVCTQCGLVVDSVADAGPEWRAYDASQLARMRAAPLRLVNKTEIGVRMEHGPRWLALASFNRDALHWREMRLAAIGAEVSRVREWPELSAFGVDWLRTWMPYARRQIVGIAKVLRRFPWMAELIGQVPVGLVNPYSVEAYAGGTGRRRVYLSAAGPTAPQTGASPLRGLSLSSADWSPMKAG
jgi:uncharacterized Zn finger protein (UPF0148 family)